MIPMINSNTASNQSANFAAGPVSQPVTADIFYALLEALTRPDHYRLVQRGGELYVEAVAPDVC